MTGLAMSLNLRTASVSWQMHSIVGRSVNTVMQAARSTSPPQQKWWAEKGLQVANVGAIQLTFARALNCLIDHCQSIPTYWGCG